MKAAAAPRWVVDADGFHRDPRLIAAGFIGGVTTQAMGNMAQEAARLKAQERLGLGQFPAYSLRQVHGKEIRSLAEAGCETVDGDGWLIDALKRVGIVFAADCMPLFLWDQRGRAAAVLHSGWKGTRANIAVQGVAALAAKGVKPDEMSAAIGPRIGPCCYAVGEDFAEYFRAESLERRAGKLYLDLGGEAAAQFRQAGVAPENISLDESCTCCGREFFSFRRDKQSHRMAAFLAMGNHGR